ncbi:hypothetical protein J663_2294 [Acinetobacter sp. 826659]|nr:hypothetical protein J663_2294 [Acinetobacter sp. 826659]
MAEANPNHVLEILNKADLTTLYPNVASGNSKPDLAKGYMNAQYVRVRSPKYQHQFFGAYQMNFEKRYSPRL